MSINPNTPPTVTSRIEHLRNRTDAVHIVSFTFRAAWIAAMHLDSIKVTYPETSGCKVVQTGRVVTARQPIKVKLIED